MYNLALRPLPLFRKQPLVGILLGGLLLLAGHTSPIAAATIKVPGDYSTIRAAIAAASPGDVIDIAAGEYDERLVINKDLTLTGAGPTKTTIWYSASRDTLVTVKGARVTLRDLKVGGATDSFGSLKQEAFMGVFADGGSLTVEHCRFVGISFARIKMVDGQKLTVKDTYSSNLPFTLASDLGIRIENTDFLIEDLETPFGSLIDHNIDVLGDATGVVKNSYLGSSSASDNWGQAFRINRDASNGYFPTITIRNNVIEGHDNKTDRQGTAIGLFAGIGSVITPSGTYKVKIYGNEIRGWPKGITIDVGATSTRNNPIKIYDNLIENNHLYGVHVHPNTGYTGTGSTRGIDLGGGLQDSPGRNVIRSNDTFSDSYALYHESGDPLDARFNTWDAQTSQMIDALIYDDDENSSSGKVRFAAPQTLMVTNVNDSGTGSLRAALNVANDGSGTPADSIHFDISGASPHVIQPQSPLPDATDPVVIDGSTEPDYAGDPVVAIDGSSISASILNLESGSGGSSVLGLSLINSSNSIALFIRTDDNLVDGCWIGLAPDGSTTPSNSWGLRTFGSSNQIGDPNGQGNVIVESSTGLGLAGGASNNAVQNNLIGKTPAGTLAGNNTGLDVGSSFGSETGNTIGGPGANEGNLVAHNAQGVLVENKAVETAIRGNRIFDNGDPGIDLGSDGQTANDQGDADDGENRFQNFPEIQSADYDGGANEVTVTYLVPSDPSAGGSGASAYPLTVDFYKADADREEGKAYLGSDTYSASSPNDYGGCGSPPCAVATTFTPQASVTRSDHLLATATDANGNTSEFSSAPHPLPVELAALEATQTDESTVTLTWTTASEHRNAGFDIQHRGPQAEAWQKLGFVESKAPSGTASQSRSYRFTADNLAVGLHWFRLKQMDLDGTAHLHDPVTIKLRMKQPLRLSPPAPNPVSETATFSFAVKEKAKATVRVYNALGQRVKTLYEGPQAAEESRRLRFDAGRLPSGVYFVRVRVAGQIKSRRITVVR